MKKISKIINIQAFTYAFFIWLNLNIIGVQKKYFSVEEITFTIVILKILHLIFLYFLCAKIHSLFEQKKETKTKNEIIISAIYFIILISTLLLIWPGAWSWDDIVILRNAASYELTPWQHFFTGLLHVLSLQTIPIPSGVMIMQSLIAAFIVGYCVSNLSMIYGKNKTQIRILQIFLIMITLLPPVIMYILAGFRMGMYSYIELLLITEMIIIYKEQKKLTIKDIIKISFLTIIISAWRTEGIYYPIFMLILYYILGKKVISKKMAIISILIVMIFNIAVGKINNIMIGNNNYSITATTESVTALVRNSTEEDKQELEIIDKVIDVQFLKDNPKMSAEKAYWEKDVVREYSDEEYSNYLKAYIKLALRHPDTVIKAMWEMFVKSGSGFGENSEQTTRSMFPGTIKIYKFGENAWSRWNSVTSRVEKYKKPLNLELRETVIRFLCGSNSENKLTIIHNIFWNLFIPFILILFSLIYKLIKKEWFMVFLILAVIARIPIIFLTAPAPYFMYYLSTYLCSYVISIIVIFECVMNLKNKKKIMGLLCEKK